MVVMSSFPPPSEGIRHEQPSTKLIINTRDYGKGTLYIAESRLAWVDNCTDRGFSIEYKHVTLHAVSRDTEAFPHECLYVMLDTPFPSPTSGAGSGEGDSNTLADYDEDDDHVDDITEIRFIPDDKSVLDTMFKALSDCQVLNPDSDNSFSSDEEVQDEEDDEDEENEYYFEDGPNRINGLSKGSEMDVDGQFDDAEEQPEN